MARQNEVLKAMEGATLAASGDVEVCRAWMALARQTVRFLRVVDAWSRGRAYRDSAEEVTAHASGLRSLLGRAEARVGDFDAGARRRAALRMGLRLAVVGKGGVGKTVLSATLARLLARRGRNVLAMDLDTNPGLAFSIGVPPSVGGLPAEALEEHGGAAYGWNLASHLSPAEVVERFAVVGPDGVRYLSLGKIDALEKEAARRSASAVLQLLLGFGDPAWDVIADLEAGPTTPFEGYHSFADRVLVVIGPEWRSALTARRLLPVIGDVPTMVIANRFREPFDHPGLVPAARVPFDEAVSEAERLGLAPVDHCPGSPAVHAMDDLARMLVTPTHEEVST